MSERTGEAGHDAQLACTRLGGGLRRACEHAQVAREAEAVGVEDAVAVDEDRLRHLLRSLAAQLGDQLDQEANLSEREVAGNVGLAEDDAAAAAVDDLEALRIEHGQAGARVRLTALYE